MTDTEQRPYPPNTPIREMTIEDQIAYWRFHAEKHAALAMTPEQEELVASGDEILAALEEHRARREQETHDAEIDEQVRPILIDAIESELKNALPHLEDVDEIVGMLNLGNFYKDGRLDRDRVHRFARHFQTPEPVPAPEPFDYRRILDPNPKTVLEGARAREIARHQ